MAEKNDLSNYQDIRIASSDASFRRYFRVTYEKQSYIVMDAPPEKETAADLSKWQKYLVK